MLHEPGSVMKSFTVAIGLKANKELRKRGEKEIFHPEDKIAASNGHFRGRKNLTDTHFHAFLNMEMAIQKSSNIYVARLVEQIVAAGKEWYKALSHNHLALEKRQASNTFRNQEILSHSREKASQWGSWSGRFRLLILWRWDTTFSDEPSHWPAACAIFANGGHLVKPTLVRKIVRTDIDGTEKIVLDNTTPEGARYFPDVLDKEIVDRVVQAMKYTTKPGGTARRGIFGDIPKQAKQELRKKSSMAVIPISSMLQFCWLYTR